MAVKTKKVIARQPAPKLRVSPKQEAEGGVAESEFIRTTPIKGVTFVPNRMFEQILGNAKIHFDRVEKYDLSKIDGAESLRNPARTTNSVDWDAMLTFRTLARTVEIDMSPLVISETWVNGKLVSVLALDGRNRFEFLHLEGIPTAAALVVRDMSPEQMLDILIKFNLWNGRRPTQDQLYASGYSQLVRSQSTPSPLTIKAVCDRLGLSVDGMNDYKTAAETVERLIGKCKIARESVEHLNRTTLIELSKVPSNPVLGRLALGLAAAIRNQKPVNTKVVHRVVAEVLRAARNGEATAVQAVNKQLDDINKTATIKTTRGQVAGSFGAKKAKAPATPKEQPLVAASRRFQCELLGGLPTEPGAFLCGPYATSVERDTVRESFRKMISDMIVHVPAYAPLIGPLQAINRSLGHEAGPSVMTITAPVDLTATTIPMTNNGDDI